MKIPLLLAYPLNEVLERYKALGTKVLAISLTSSKASLHSDEDLKSIPENELRVVKIEVKPSGIELLVTRFKDEIPSKINHETDKI